MCVVAGADTDTACVGTDTSSVTNTGTVDLYIAFADGVCTIYTPVLVLVLCRYWYSTNGRYALHELRLFCPG